MQAVDGAIPVGPEWAFEFVWDGLRAQIYLDHDRAWVLAGSGRPVTRSYPELTALRTLVGRYGTLVLDGYLLVPDRFGRASLARLRERSSTSKPSPALLERLPVYFFPVDVLYARQTQTLDWPYRRRRALLEELDFSGLPVELPPSFVDSDGQTVLHAAQQHGVPGIVAKRLDSRYHPGRRSRAWVQTLPRHTQPVLVGGWQPTPRDPDQPGALLIGLPDAGGKLRYLGKVTAGLNVITRAELVGSLGTLASANNPFVDAPVDKLESAHWLHPKLVGEVSYRRWAPDGRLRHASWVRVSSGAHPASARGPLVLGGEGAEKEAAGDGRAAAQELGALDEAVRLAQAEVRALRAQISAHFVYNALNAISAYVRTDPERARQLLHDFAGYTRYSFQQGASLTTLGDELENVDRYLALQGARFGERLRVERSVAPEVLDVALPFLTVQAMVETAVQHGIEGSVDGGTLRINAQSSTERIPDEPEHCVVTVTDDGPNANSGQRAEALCDVRERLAAAPGPVSALEVVHTGATGTTVTLRLPM
jgi:bifunctional non-homologous end joining protein LigD